MGNAADSISADELRAVELPDPDEKPYSEWSRVERQAFIYGEVEEASHPRNLRQKDYVELFDRSKSVISEDFTIVKRAFAEQVEPHASALAVSVFETSTQKLMEQEKYEAASRVVGRYMSFLQDTGRQTKAAEKREVSIEQGETETDAMRVVGPDGEPFGEDW